MTWSPSASYPEEQKRLGTEQQVNRVMHCPPWCADPRIEPGLPRRRIAGSRGMERERSPDDAHRVIGIASLLVAGAFEIRLAIRGMFQVPLALPRKSLSSIVPPPSVVDPHSPAVVLIDVIVASAGIRLRCRMGRMPDNASLNRRLTCVAQIFDFGICRGAIVERLQSRSKTLLPYTVISISFSARGA